MLIFTHVSAQGTQGRFWTEALTTVSKQFSTERDRLGTSEVGCVATGRRRHSVAETHSTPSRERTCSKTFPNTSNVSFTVLRVCISSRCSTTLPRNQTCTNEPCRQSNPCVHTGKRRTRDQGNHCRCLCVDFFCWKTQHSQDLSKFLSSESRVRATRTITLPTR